MIKEQYQESIINNLIGVNYVKRYRQSSPPLPEEA